MWVTAAPTASCLSKGPTLLSLYSWFIPKEETERLKHQFPIWFCSYLCDLGNSSVKQSRMEGPTSNSLPVPGIKCSASTPCGLHVPGLLALPPQPRGGCSGGPLHSTAGSGSSLPSSWLLAQGLNGLATSLRESGCALLWTLHLEDSLASFPLRF